MDAELLALCKQTVTRQAYVGYDDHNDFTWQTDITSQSVVLTLLVGVVVHLGMMTGTLVVKDATDTDIYSAVTDYEIDYTTGLLKRRAGSTIPTGSTVHCSYSWQTITTIAARVEFTNVLIRNSEGQEVVSTCQIYCNGDTVIDLRDKITISGTTVTYPEILAIAENPDENGVIDHKVIFTK